MKKLLSVLMAILFILPNHVAKGYDIINLPGGEKKIVYSYGELQELSEHHKQLAQDIMDKSKHYDNVKFASNLVGCGSMIVGALWFLSNINKDGTMHKDGTIHSMLAGSGLFALGLLSLIGGHWYSNHNTDKLQKQKDAISLTKSEITGTKYYVDDFISKNYITTEQAAKDFYYIIYLDNQGFVYQTELGGASILHSIVPLETKYKFYI